MKLVLQRVKEASVSVDGQIIGQIGRGILVFLGVERGYTRADADHFVRKITELRMFEDPSGKMNLSPGDVQAAFLVVSQFTLLGDCRKGRRPSFDRAAAPQTARTLYEYFVEKLRTQRFKVATGRFQALMDVALVNDGPVTFVLEGHGR